MRRSSDIKAQTEESKLTTAQLAAAVVALEMTSKNDATGVGAAASRAAMQELDQRLTIALVNGAMAATDLAASAVGSAASAVGSAASSVGSAAASAVGSAAAATGSAISSATSSVSAGVTFLWNCVPSLSTKKEESKAAVDGPQLASAAQEPPKPN